MSLGKPLLIENVEEDLDPVLDPVLDRKIIRKGKACSIVLGDKEVGASWPAVQVHFDPPVSFKNVWFA